MEDRSTRRPFLRFLGWFMLFPLLAYFAAFPLVRVRSYARWSPSLWGSILDYAFQAGHQDADIVIFGDSSAFIGIDPRMVRQQLGLKTIVLPGTIGSLPVTGEMALRRYLKANKRPRLLVFYFSAWNLDYAHTQKFFLFEGQEMLFRHGSAAEMASYSVHHPIETFLFPLRLYSTFSPRMLRSLIKGEDRSRATIEAFGHADYPDFYQPLSGNCTLPDRLIKPGSDATVHELAQRYAGAAEQVMVYLGPVPACTNANAVTQRSFARLNAAAPAQLPANEFLADPNYAHMRSGFVATSSRLFTDALRRRLEGATKR